MHCYCYVHYAMEFNETNIYSGHVTQYNIRFVREISQL